MSEIPEADATPDEAFELGKVAGYADALKELQAVVDQHKHFTECGWDVPVIELHTFIDGLFVPAARPA